MVRGRVRRGWGLFGTVAFALLAISIAACGGGGPGGSSHVLPGVTGAAGTTGMAKVVLVVHRGALAGSASVRRPAYVSAATQSFTLSVQPQAVPSAKPIAVTVSCTPSPADPSAPSTCSASVAAPPGPDLFTVALYDASNGKGNLLSSGSTVVSIVPNAANTVSLVTDGQVASIRTGFMPPILTLGVKSTIGLSVTGLDAAGNTIVGTYANPISLAYSDPSGSTSLGATVVSAAGTPVLLVYDGAANFTQATLAVTADGVASGATPAAALAAVACTTPVATPAPDSVALNCTYQSSAQTYLNTEGGPWIHVDVLHTAATPMARVTAPGVPAPLKLIHAYICLSDLSVNPGDCPANYPLNGASPAPLNPTPMPSAALAAIENAFVTAQQAHVKLIVRFIYNFGPAKSPPPSPIPVPSSQDAALATIVEHMNQLQPIVLAHAQVINTLEVGFLGYWGEWHDSHFTVDGVQSAGSNDNQASRYLVTQAFLHDFGGGPGQGGALPWGGSIPLVNRYPADMLAYLTTTPPPDPGPTPAAQPYACNASLPIASAAPIMGIHDDAFASNSNDGGTFGPWYQGPCYPATQLEAYMAAAGRTFEVVGEPANLGDPNTVPAGQTCAQFPAYAQSYDLQSLNVNPYGNGALANAWQQGGCLAEIVNHVGPRIVLNTANITGTIGPGATLAMTLTMTNEGWGRVMTARPVWLVLQTAAGVPACVPNSQQQQCVVPLRGISLTSLKPQGGPGVPQSFQTSAVLPSGLVAGPLVVSLAFPDVAPALQSDPLYDLLLNDAGIVQPASGLATLFVVPAGS